MEWIVIAEVAAISSMVGLGTYCLACAVHVWRKRNATVRAPGGVGGVAGVLRRASTLLLVVGLLGMLLSTVWQAAVPQEGILSGDGLFTVLRPADFDVVDVAGSDAVSQHATLARYRSAGATTEIAVLKLRRESLVADQQVLLHQPLAVDPEITQKIAEQNAQDRNGRSNLTNFVLEQEKLLRDSLRSRLATQDEINKLQREMSQLQGEFQQAQSNLAQCQAEHERLAKLHQRGVSSEQEYSEKASELAAQQIEVRKLEEQFEKTCEQKAELEQALDSFRKFGEDQARVLGVKIAEVETQLREIASLQEDLEQQRAGDLVRAQRHREELLKKIGVELEQAEQQLAGWTRRLEILAPFAGRVVYRATSPGSVNPGEPLIVMAPADGLRLSVRLPRWMKSHLARAEEAHCRLLEDLERDEQRRFVECRFPAALASWKDLPAHPGYALAEMRCELPGEAVRLLARGEQIAARLLWRPPFYRAPMFLFCAVLATIAAFVRSVSGRWAASPSAERRFQVPAAQGVINPEITTEFGGEGAMLRLLGAQLREMTVRHELDAHGIAAAEWALDRHRARAVRLLALGMGEGDELCDSLENLVKQCVHENGISADVRRRSFGLLHRLVAILQTAGPEGSHERVRRIARQLSSPGHARSKGTVEASSWRDTNNRVCAAGEELRKG
jgi:multidrug resistance efflux pump